MTPSFQPPVHLLKNHVYIFFIHHQIQEIIADHGIVIGDHGPCVLLIQQRNDWIHDFNIGHVCPGLNQGKSRLIAKLYDAKVNLADPGPHITEHKTAALTVNQRFNHFLLLGHIVPNRIKGCDIQLIFRTHLEMLCSATSRTLTLSIGVSSPSFPATTDAPNNPPNFKASLIVNPISLPHRSLPPAWKAG